MKYKDFEYIKENNEITIAKYCGDDKEVVVPSEINGCPVTKIGEYAFFNCRFLKKVELPDSLISICQCAFYDCKSLKSIVLPKRLKTIKSYTFYSCTSLEKVEIPNSVTEIGIYAFENCISLKAITIPDSVTKISDYAFNLCENLNYIFYKGEIGKKTLGNCNAVVLPYKSNYLNFDI